MKIKESPKLKMIPVIMYSTTSNATDVNEYKRLGAREFIVKPTSFTNLVNILREVIK